MTSITYKITVDRKAIQNELDLLFRMMRKRKIEETQFEGILGKIVSSHMELST